ncbi:MAG: tetratricopeptide repeat protein [Acidobacteria bacterium]|nr:tetratricopeptide repeat protein [Acidobacteriota bacterium]
MIEKKRIFFALLLLLLFFPLSSASVWAQSGGGGGGGSSGGGSSGGGNSGGSTTGGQQSSGTQAERQRPMFLSGRVLLDDGQPPGSRTKVELICQGSVVRQEYTSHSGTFSMEIAGGQPGARPMDASVPSSGYSQLGGGSASSFGSTGIGGGLASTRSIDLSNCELKAQLPEYQSDVISLGRRRVLDNPDVGLIILHSMKPPEIGTVSIKTLAAPKDARKAYEKAGKELQKEKPNFSKASKELAKAVKIYPEFASAWYMLGEVRLAQNDRPAASEAFEEAKAADTEYANPYLSLALMALEEERWQAAADLCNQALELNSRLTKAHYFNALANSSLGRIDVAEESALVVLDSNQAKNYPLIYYVLGFTESKKGNFPSAAARYRSLLEIKPDGSLAGKLREQMAQWQEQGLIQ